LSFAVPFSLLYYLDTQSFNETWKGRTFYLFFIWLFVLEVVLNWDRHKSETTNKLDSNVRSFAFAATLLLPTVYAVIANFYGLNQMITEFSTQYGVPWTKWMPLTTEYLVFTIFFALIIYLAYGLSGLANFSLSTFVLGVIGTVYMIDNIYPNGLFTPFQILVLPTAMLASSVLNFMGYRTLLGVTSGPEIGEMPHLTVLNPEGKIAGPFTIAWPCSGVQSLLIYTFTILLFLKKTDIPWKHRLIYFVIGAVVTYFINILRIVSIFVIAITGGDWALFHNYYGELYAMTWIIAYPLVIIGSRVLWRKIKPKFRDNNVMRGLLRQSPTA